jgi:phage tail-like protein
MAVDARTVSTLLDSLPAVFQEDRVGGGPTFLGRFLLGFEQILLGLDPAEGPGLEETIAHIYRYFEPGAELPEGERAPEEFLHWLAGWVAITLREDWDQRRQRDLIAKAVPLYRLRGTKRGVEEFLSIYTRLGVRIDELMPAFQLGVHSTVGVDTTLDGGAPFFFHVRIFLPEPPPQTTDAGGIEPAVIRAQRSVAHAIVDLQKPAHTFYTLSVETPILQVGVHAAVGIDTLLGHDRNGGIQ